MKKSAKREWFLRNKEKVYAKRRALRAQNREKIAAAKRDWGQRNPEAVSMQRVRTRLKRMNGMADKSLRFHYGVTLEAFNAVAELQGHVCAICGTHDTTTRAKRLVVDHDHQTGRVRALLCHRCNCGLGYFKDNPALLRKALVYLEAFAADDSDGAWLSRALSVLGRLSTQGQSQ